MIKSEFTFLEVQIKGFTGDAIEFRKPSFSVSSASLWFIAKAMFQQ